MFDITEIFTRKRRPTAGLLPILLLALCAAFPGGLSAQEPLTETGSETGSEADSEAAAAAPEVAEPVTPEADALRRQIDERYEVLPVRGGLVLQPREDFRGVRTIEITGSALAVNGRSIGREELRDWMGERAEAVLRVADLEPEERLRLFDAEEPAQDADAEEDEDGESAVRVAPEVPEAPEPPEPPDVTGRRVHRGSQTVVGSSVRIARDEVADDVVVLGGSADIEGRVEGDVVVFGGPVDVEGEVTRDVTAIGGNVYLGEDSEVGGEVTAVGGRVRRDAGARVRGGINEVQRGFRGPSAPVWAWDWGRWDGPNFSPVGWMASMIWPIAELLFLALLVIFLVAIARPTVERVGTRAGAEPLKSGIVGLLVGILIVPAFLIVSVLLALSIIGIPILLVLVLLFVFVGIPALLIAALVGYSGVAWRLGRWSEGRFGWRLESAIMAAVVGLLFLHVLDLVGHALDFGPLRVFGVMFLLTAAVVQFVAWCVGFGAVVLELYDRRQRRRAVLAAGVPGAVPPGSPPATPPPAATPPPPPPAAPPPSAPPPEGGTE